MTDNATDSRFSHAQAHNCNWTLLRNQQSRFITRKVNFIGGGNEWRLLISNHYKTSSLKYFRSRGPCKLNYLDFFEHIGGPLKWWKVGWKTSKIAWKPGGVSGLKKWRRKRPGQRWSPLDFKFRIFCTNWAFSLVFHDISNIFIFLDATKDVICYSMLVKDHLWVTCSREKNTALRKDKNGRRGSGNRPNETPWV